MNEDFFKFPSTPHLIKMPGVDIRGDKLLTESERDEFLRHTLTVEEKVDGANLGISFDEEGNIRAQNRGGYLSLPGSGQWKKLGEWLAHHADVLFECIADRYILFGEWCYAQHTVFYNRLPDWFLGFDIYNKHSGLFLSTDKRNRLLERAGIAKVPLIAKGHFSHSEIEGMLSQSKISDQPAEGLYLRHDEGPWLNQRAKLVRSEFIQAVELHWSRSPIKSNQLISGRISRHELNRKLR